MLCRQHSLKFLAIIEATSAVAPRGETWWEITWFRGEAYGRVLVALASLMLFQEKGRQNRLSKRCGAWRHDFFLQQHPFLRSAIVLLTSKTNLCNDSFLLSTSVISKNTAVCWTSTYLASKLPEGDFIPPNGCGMDIYSDLIWYKVLHHLFQFFHCDH